MDPRQLADIFRTRLGSTQSNSQIALFDAELMRCNLGILDVALKEARIIAGRSGPPRNARDAVMGLYDLKLAEQSQLFPVFFIFESAFRSFAAARLKGVYGDDQWWLPVRDALSVNRNVRLIRRLGNLPARRDVVDTVEHLLKGMGTGAGHVATSYDLLAGGTLAHVERLIGSHWTAIDQALRHDPSRPRLTSSTFTDLFKIVRNARNDAYHHRLVQDRPRVVRIVEQLVDMLDMSLEKRIAAVDGALVSNLQFSIPIQPRHA